MKICAKRSIFSKVAGSQAYSQELQWMNSFTWFFKDFTWILRMLLYWLKPPPPPPIKFWRAPLMFSTPVGLPKIVIVYLPSPSQKFHICRSFCIIDNFLEISPEFNKSTFSTGNASVQLFLRLISDPDI